MTETPTDFARQLAEAIIDMAESDGGLIRSKLEATIDAHVAIGGSDTFKKAAHVLAVLDAMRGVQSRMLDPRGWEKAQAFGARPYQPWLDPRRWEKAVRS